MGTQSSTAPGSLPSPATLVLAVSAVVAAAPAYLLWSAFGETLRVLFLVALAVSLFPAILYRALWPTAYGHRRAAAWGVAASAVVSAELAALMVLLGGPLGPDLAVVVAVVVVYLGNYELPKRYLARAQD